MDIGIPVLIFGILIGAMVVIFGQVNDHFRDVRDGRESAHLVPPAEYE